jgi:hypothetical protein
MISPTRLKRSAPPGQAHYRLSGGQEAVIQVALADEPTHTSFPLRVHGTVQDGDVLVELPANVHNLHPDQIAHGPDDFLDTFIAGVQDAAAVRMERYLNAHRAARALPRHGE